ncbi:hypothetical protein D029_4738B, partial [Vibrio parahaemolyticus 970107]
VIKRIAYFFNFVQLTVTIFKEQRT